MDQSEVRISTIHSAVGGITETDVVLADAAGSNTNLRSLEGINRLEKYIKKYL